MKDTCVLYLGVKWLVWSLNLVRVATLEGAIDGNSLNAFNEIMCHSQNKQNNIDI